MNFRRFAGGLVLAGMVLSYVSRVDAQTLVDRVPDDAMIYIGWQGTDTLGPAYEKSKLKQFVDRSAIPELFNKTIPELVEKAAKNEPGKAEDFKLGTAFFKLIARHPTAFYVGGFEIKAGEDEPQPHFGLICQAGVDKDLVLAAFSKFAADSKDSDMPLKAVSDGEFVALFGGYGKDQNVSVRPTKSLGASAGFTAAKSQLGKSPAVVVYIDAANILARVDDALKKNLGEMEFTGWTRAKEAAGIAGLKRFVYSAGFVGEDWTSQSFIDAPAPRTGLLKLLEPAAIDQALMARMPADATSASIRQFDFAQLIDTAKAITTAANPEAGQKFQQALGLVALSLGRKLDSELLAPLGAQWAIYNAPGLGDGQITSMVIANKLDDPQLAKAAWGDLAFAISNTVPNLVRRNMNVVVTPSADEKSLPGSTVFTWQIGGTPWAPGFVVNNGFVYLSGNPQTLIKAAKAPDSKFEANPKFAKLIQALGAPKFSAVSFDDLAESADSKSEAMDQSWAMVVAQAQNAGVQLPAKLFPSLEEIKPLLSSAGSLSWADDKGFYSVERSPFPMSSMVYGYSGADQMTTVGASALGISILLPSLNRARETANRVKAASNLKQIGMGMILYSNDNKGAAPPDLGSLLAQGLTVDVFVSPSGGTVVPPNIRDGTPQQQATWVNENSDFVYINPAGKLTLLNSETPLAYEKLGLHGRDGINILYADGHVEFQVAKIAEDIIKQSTGAKPVEYKRPAKSAK